MTKEEMNDIIENSTGHISDWNCRVILHWMMGYMRFASNLEAARDAFFTEVKNHTKKGEK